MVVPDTVYELAHAEAFPLELSRAPKKVQSAYLKSVMPLLRQSPDASDPPRIKKLHGYRDLWRVRVGKDYRLVYKVASEENLVTMLMLDHRERIYARLGRGRDGSPGIRIVAAAEHLLEVEPTVVESKKAAEELVQQEIRDREIADAPTEVLSRKNLEAWGVPTPYHASILSLKRVEELLALGPAVPDEVVLRVLNALWPPRIEEVVEQPVRVTSGEEDLAMAADGAASLESFLLRLDADQKAYVERFRVQSPAGPWLLKAGPGSGKTTVALYCIQALIKSATESIDWDNKGLRILFTTFTKALTRSSEQLLAHLVPRQSKHSVEVRTVDSLAASFSPEEMRSRRLEVNPLPVLREVVTELSRRNSSFPFSPSEAEFLLDEIEWVIVGRSLKSVDEYLSSDRAGRLRALSKEQRKQVWALSEEFYRKLHSQGNWTFSERLEQAMLHATPRYDYVFIDEAQDLKPTAIRFCIALCREKRNIFLTADSNQSIYGSGLAWATVAKELRFQGRAKILYRNYRCTREIWDAVTDLDIHEGSEDRETMTSIAVGRGIRPTLVWYSDLSAIRERLNTFLWESLKKERLTTGCAAILCPSHRDVDRLAQLVDPALRPMAMKSADVDLAHPGVKVMTMHAAKGLQFPVVAVARVEEGVLPWDRLEFAGEDRAKQAKLLFVACTRAMKRLIMFASSKKRSSFLRNMPSDAWSVECL